MLQIKNEAAFLLNVAPREEILALEKLINFKHTPCQLQYQIIFSMFFHTFLGMIQRLKPN